MPSVKKARSAKKPQKVKNQRPLWQPLAAVAVVLGLAGIGVYATRQSHAYCGTDQYLYHNMASVRSYFEVQDSPSGPNTKIYIGKHQYFDNPKEMVYVPAGYDIYVYDMKTSYKSWYTSTGWHLLPYFANGCGDMASIEVRKNK